MQVFKKYKQTLDTERKTGVKDLAAYLNDVQEELMDAILYIQAAREELSEAKDKVYGDKFKWFTILCLGYLVVNVVQLDLKK